VRSGSQRLGITINSFASVSLDPPLVLWSLARNSSNLPAFRATRHHGVSVLAADQCPLARRFASRTSDRFAGSDWHSGPFDTLLLDGALSHLVCDLRDLRAAGDHVILLGEVVYHRQRAGAPLVFHGGAYWTTAPRHERCDETPSAA
jgi:unspecific monooxygenase